MRSLLGSPNGQPLPDPKTSVRNRRYLAAISLRETVPVARAAGPVRGAMVEWSLSDDDVEQLRSSDRRGHLFAPGRSAAHSEPVLGPEHGLS